jgi:hypothetical protein
MGMTKQTHDDIIEKMFNEYIDRVTKSGMPHWVCDIYGTGSTSVPDDFEDEPQNTNDPNKK